MSADPVVERARRRTAARLLGVPASRLASTEVPDLDATLFAEPVRGGASLVVGADGTVLYGGSAVAPTLVDEFRRGRRTPPEAFTDPDA